MNDDLIQKLLDEGQGDSLPEGQDAEFYRKMYALLDKPEAYSPTPGFAHRVTAALDRSESKTATTSLIAGVSMGILVLLLAVAALVIYYKVSFPVDRMTITLLIMFGLGSLLTGLYRIIEKRFLHG